MKHLVSIEESIKDILLTPLGSRVMCPEYGSRLFELVDRKIDDEFRADLAYFVIEAVQKWEKRVKIDEVRLISFENHALKFRISFTNGTQMEISNA
ncbi:GPW/gp25 family protein [Campylobacter hyointestinalis]|uniref:Baseplate assembly protein n=1 Tax=Campylobacter hyointestinalis subsp. hyointestinalis TaxID=91352 RepID=A0A855N524_CAMHY|nr:GPW/gp25 family protein [Campylobacter hyointestinalis]PPB54985.1 baseplate assembly protein [Campylobacter hyointestinalis subsp. hyointestinalis]PPB57578.1 baseplate assembly protein [Campylobacter hyointestinalis subsp. hyointestinalis]PPB58615.1 baseplate assembly protein [Campylobacter hyointestinalis subsp. hyointestinalis]PPB60473.1 baseplate assembly protein [Campylobacter hyointestinalis subsp. hyointestinalis]PPB61887.1 baseplate assembly protein [Campylobacter hyointestinalis sub